MDPRYLGANLVTYKEVRDDGPRPQNGVGEDAYYRRHTPSRGWVMKLAPVATVLAFMLTAPAAHAVDLIKVPAMCGTAAEILETLALKMPNPRAIGKGGDGRGTDIATLFTGNGYWALLALMSPTSVCVVASGYNWTVTDPQQATSY
jgi:hypothetical protein